MHRNPQELVATPELRAVDLDSLKDRGRYRYCAISLTRRWAKSWRGARFPLLPETTRLSSSRLPTRSYKRRTFP
jgi:hypothetical protein